MRVGSLGEIVSLDLEDVVGQAVAGELGPGVAAVGGFVQAAFRADERAVLPWSLLTLPHAAKTILGVGDRSGLRMLRCGRRRRGRASRFFRRQWAVEAALFVGAVGMAGDSDEDAVRVFGIDGDLADLLAVAQAFEVGPGFAGVGGLVDSVAGGKIRALQTFAATDVDGFGVAIRDGDGADASRGFDCPRRYAKWLRRPWSLQTPPLTAPSKTLRVGWHAGKGAGSAGAHSGPI